jgi:glycerol-3-phosphate O-acyltransferase/dihydroxyacetone phosphate acyltransferase
LAAEGISRYFPTVAKLKTGIARIAAEVLRKESETPSYELTIVPISITYLHREKVLILSLRMP